MNKIDWSKPIEAYSGLPARLICVDMINSQNLSYAVLVRNKDGEHLNICNSAGIGAFGIALVRNVAPKKRTIWLNIYGNEATVHSSSTKADLNARKGRVACVPLTYCEGEGLSNPDTAPFSF